MPLPNLAQELKEMIVDHLPLRPSRYISRIFRVKLTSEMRTKKIWGAIFADHRGIRNTEKMGLTPILVGHDLYMLEHRYHLTTWPKRILKHAYISYLASTD
jgi:hypothetical protein